MADPSAPVAVNKESIDLGISKGAIVNAETIPEGAHISGVFGSGTVQQTADEANALPMGYVGGSPNQADKLGQTTWLGTNDADEADPQVNALAKRVRELVVVGVAAYADRWKAVFATDGQTYTLTRPADDAVPIGYVWDMPRDNVSTTCEVYHYDVTQSIMLGIVGGTKKSIMIGLVGTTVLEGTSAIDLIAGFILWGHGNIVKLYARASGFDASYAAGDQTMNLEIGGTNVTGGVLTLAESDVDAVGDSGLEIAATAITALNEFHDGDLLDLELIASGTGFTAAIDTVTFAIYIDIEYLPGA